MPELPEVETIRRGLDPQVRGLVIADAVTGLHRGFLFDYSKFRTTIKGQVILGLSRRGKYLVFELETHYCIFHLGMTGQLTLRDPQKEDVPFERHPITGLQKTSQHAVDKHTHLQFLLETGSLIFFRDVRKFGKVVLLRREEGALDVFFRHLGLEPFSSDYDLGEFLSLMRDRKSRIKSWLLDQRFVAGVGNIYADEALFEAGVHPSRRVNQLRLYEKHSLFDAIPLVLERGIRFGGTSIRDFVNSGGETGGHQEKLKVYGRNGQPCHACEAILEKTVVSQRGSHYCPVCQPRNGPRRVRSNRESAAH